MQAKECWVSAWHVACHDVVSVCEGAQCSHVLLMYQMVSGPMPSRLYMSPEMACTCQIIETNVIFCVCA